MGKIHEIDTIISRITDEKHQQLYARWSKEYKQRYYEDKNKKPLQKRHSNYPGFEKNLNAILFCTLKDKDPHSEWPYASCIDESTEKVDLHYIDNENFEFWFELGMYATDEKVKYYKDFHKLLAVVSSRPKKNIGILIHFEIYKKNKVFPIFQELQSQYNNRFLIDIKKFENNQNTIACRLFIKNIEAEQGGCT